MSEQPTTTAVAKAAPKKDFVIPPKKPKLSKAERRALQEQQRAAKAGGGKPKGKPDNNKQQQSKDHAPAPLSPKNKQKQEGGAAEPASLEPLQRRSTTAVSMLEHLPPYRDPKDHPDQFLGVQLGGPEFKKLHPAVLQAGLDYCTNPRVQNGNARCRIMLYAFIAALQDFELPSKSEGDVRNHLNNLLFKPSFNYWTLSCRPHSVSMGNAFSFVKSAVAALDRETSLKEAKEVLVESMEAYIRERIEYAGKAIANFSSEKIVDGDVILVYANSEVISVILKEAALGGKKFRVIVVDSKPLLEGKTLLDDLVQAGLECTYILLNALSFVMKDVTKVFLGAEALMNDGSVYARIGTACVALSAKGKPVLVCSETYKISNRIQLESITINELGDPQSVVPGKLPENLRVINLMYDLTPANFVSGIITEMGILPPTSVAVLLREMNPQDSYSAFG